MSLISPAIFLTLGIMRNWILISTVLTFLFLSLNSIACRNPNNDMKKETVDQKSCCSSKKSVEEKSCCCSSTEKGEKETKKCNGSCKHKGCNSTSNASFYLKSNDYLPLTSLNFEEEVKNLWSYSQPKIIPVYLSIWQPPKI
jgi:hypothetical protein